MGLPKTFDVYLQRTPAMRILGEMVTFRFPAFLINAVLIASIISLLFESRFSLFSILVSALIFFPLFLFIQLRFINRGSYLMKKHAVLTIDEEEIGVLIGYPFSFKYKTETIERSDIKGLLLKGDPTFGFFLEFQQDSTKKESKKAEKKKKTGKRSRHVKSQPTRFGLWTSDQEALEFGEEIASYLNLELKKSYSPDGKKKIIS